MNNLRNGNHHLSALLYDERTIIHPFIIGELALGNLRDRDSLLYDLKRLPRVPVATEDEVLFFIERRELAGRGIGYVDAHLLASASLLSEVRLWTLDRRLSEAAFDLGLGYEAR